MKQFFYLLIISAIAITGCRKIVVDDNGTEVIIDPGGNPSGKTITLSGKITSDTTLRAINTYILDGLVYVKNGATITIEEGTLIKGSYRDPIGGLVITKGAKLVAKGSADKPIVFTSNSPSPRSGDWAGVVILGKAPTNSTFNGLPARVPWKEVSIMQTVMVYTVEPMKMITAVHSLMSGLSMRDLPFFPITRLMPLHLQV
jgi:hypothetical protein